MVAAQSLRSVFRALVQMYIYFYCAKMLLQYFKLSFRLNYSIVHFEPLRHSPPAGETEGFNCTLNIVHCTLNIEPGLL